LKLVVLYGLPAAGKLTVARELAELTGYRLFHNHLAVDLLLSVFDFGSPAFVELREQIWLSVFERAAPLDGLIFTFAPEATVRPEFLTRAETVVAQSGGEIIFIELVCPDAELRRRLTNSSRSQHGKLNSLELFDQLTAQGAFKIPVMPAPRLTIDTSLCSPREAAAQIAQALAIDTLS
jgi:chloramphenicol 3-O-phosphotransferase